MSDASERDPSRRSGGWRRRTVDRPDEVDEAYARCRSTGAKIHFPPQYDRDEEGYYAFFAFDPDGIRVELFCWPQADGNL
jgi:hypothetical protein